MVGNGKSGAPDTDFSGVMDESLNGLRQSAGLAEARGKKKKSEDYGYEENEV